MLQGVHHVHYVVEDRDAMMDYLKKTFGMTPTLLRESNRSGKLAHYDLGQSQMQITSPIDPQSGIGKFLAKNGPGVYHVAWEIKDAQKTSEDMVAKGNKLKRFDGKEKITPNRDGDLVCSVDPVSSLGVVFQLVQRGPGK